MRSRDEGRAARDEGRAVAAPRRRILPRGYGLEAGGLAMRRSVECMIVLDSSLAIGGCP